MQISSIATELHSKVVIWVNNNVYSLAQMTLNITHVSGKGGYNGVMTLKLSRCEVLAFVCQVSWLYG